jgi:hypothetical protein
MRITRPRSPWTDPDDEDLLNHAYVVVETVARFQLHLGAAAVVTLVDDPCARLSASGHHAWAVGPVAGAASGTRGGRTPARDPQGGEGGSPGQDGEARSQCDGDERQDRHGWSLEEWLMA